MTKCSVCGEAFANTKSLQSHLKMHKDGYRYSCPSCGKSYVWRKSLLVHIKASKVCSASSFVTGSSTTVNPSFQVESRASEDISQAVHMTETGLGTCASSCYHATDGDASKLCQTEVVLDQITADVNGAVIIRDKKAESDPASASTNGDEEFMYPCLNCGKPFKKEEQMWHHFEGSHCVSDQSPTTTETTCNAVPSTKSAKCPVCLKHFAKHNGAKNFSCPCCDRRFAWKSSLHKHLKRTGCGKNLDDVDACTSSTVKRTPVIDERLVSQSQQKSERKAGEDLPLHSSSSSKCLKNQQGEGTLSSGSNKGNPNSKLARAHTLLEKNKSTVIVEDYVRSSILYHEGFGVKEGMADCVDVGSGPEIGRHKCKVCCKVYKYKSSLKLHLRDHTGEVPYQCRHCRERFSSKKLCRKHVMEHGAESKNKELRDALKQVMKINLTRIKSKGSTTRRKRGAAVTESSEVFGVVNARKLSGGCLPASSKVEVSSEERCIADDVQSGRQEHRTSSESSKGSAYAANCLEVADSTGQMRKARRRTMKYFDLDEGSDDEWRDAGRGVGLSRVVRESLGRGDSSIEEVSIGKEGLVEAAKRSKRNEAVIVSDEEWINRSSEQEWKAPKSYPKKGKKSPGSAKLMSPSSQKQKVVEGNGEDAIDVHGKSKLLFQCKICDTKFSSRFVLRRHEVITGHAKASYECPYCKRIYSEGGAYSNHMFVHQRKNGMNCDKCGKELQSRTTFLNHMEMHRKNPFTCKLCFEWFPSDEKLQGHISTSHDEQKEFKCKYCHKTFDWQSNYTRHMNKHTNKKEFKCKICHYSFNIISNLKRHMVSVHKGETGLETSTWEAINPAQVDHVLNRQHQRRNLWHVKSEENDVAATPGKRRGRLKALKAVNRKKYNCQVCSFLCSSRVELTNHLRFAHQQKSDPETALIHFIIEDENFVCQLCGSVIYIRHSLKNHMRNVHQMDVCDEDIAGVSKSRTTAGQCQAKDEREEEPAAEDSAVKNCNAVEVFAEEATSAADAVGGMLVKKASSKGRDGLKNCGSFRKKEVVADCSSKMKQGRKAGSGSSPAMRGQGIARASTSDTGWADQEAGDAEHPGWIDCSLCKDRFQSKDMLIQHLRSFHKIPAGLEDALIELTKDVRSVKNEPRAMSILPNGRGHKSEKNETVGERKVRKAPSHNCPICNAKFQTVFLLKSHAAVCENFSLD